ncbi:glycine oxidase ThiO [Inquilinus sp. CA228]|uniref:glycine oxidase ThiO n=1 Tax=Inquilinus sp. CA228 TaxID=3455609 RepID=UPI003F8D835A
MHATVIGAGVVGLACALELAERGVDVSVIDRGDRLGAGSASWYAGGMLAPWCELESAEPLVAELGEEAIGWWSEKFPETVRNGSLVVAQGRDLSELDRFARRTHRLESVGEARIAELEPDLAGRFHKALFFSDEAHIDPRRALSALKSKLEHLGVKFTFGLHARSDLMRVDVTVDCRGLAARDVLTDLRGVKGEMLIMRTNDVSLSRPVRMLHPRIPIYVVPRASGHFMVGATMIESDDQHRISVRSMLELLGSAYALHPAFAEAEIVEIGTGVRPSFADNLPRLRWRGNTLYVNGVYRHGFLLAPALARMAADAILHGHRFPEVMDEDHLERRTV